MQYTSVGDIAYSFLMRGHNTRIKSEVADLSQNLASGMKTDVSKHLRGEFTGLAAIERSIRSLEAHQTAQRETTTLLETAQITLGSIQDITTEMAPALISAGNSSHPALLRSVAADAEQKLDSVVSALNVRIADRAIFSGRSTDRAALPSGREILDALSADLVGAASPLDVANQIDIWFDDPAGGFVTTIYQGANQPISPIPVSDTEAVDFRLTANAPEFRNLLKSIAKAALSVELPQLSDTKDQAEFLKSAGEAMLSTQTGLALLRADVGALESYNDIAKTRANTSLSAFEIARSEIYKADPFEAASALELAQTQLEAVYTLTARISRLSLADYLR